MVENDDSCHAGDQPAVSRSDSIVSTQNRAGLFDSAIRIVAKWPHLGDAREAVTTAIEVVKDPTVVRDRGDSSAARIAQNHFPCSIQERFRDAPVPKQYVRVWTVTCVENTANLCESVRRIANGSLSVKVPYSLGKMGFSERVSRLLGVKRSQAQILSSRFCKPSCEK